MILNHKKTTEFGKYLAELARVGSVQDLVNVAVELSVLDGSEHDKDEQNSIKGDLFEVFGEYLIRTAGGNHFLPVNREGYNPNNPNDYGVDGFGTYAGRAVTVQFKFRSNRFDTKHGFITFGEVSNFFRQSVTDFKIPFDKFHEHTVLITTGQGYNEHEQEGGAQHPFLVNFDSLDGLVGTNQEFWAGFVGSVEETFEATKVNEIKPLWPHQEKALADIKAWLNDSI